MDQNPGDTGPLELDGQGFLLAAPSQPGSLPGMETGLLDVLLEGCPVLPTWALSGWTNT